MKLTFKGASFILACLVTVFTSCKKDYQPANLERLTGNPTEALTPQSILAGGSVDSSTDWSGTVHTIIVTNQVSGNHPLVDVTIPSDYLLVGGGAVVTPEQGTPGALLTASYPDANLRTWHAASKDHILSYYHTLVGYAIGLKLDGVPRDILRQYVNLDSASNGPLNITGVSFGPNNGSVVIGGGAKVTWTNPGNLLFACYSSHLVGILAASKDHIEVSPAILTGYYISIQPVIPNFGTLDFQALTNTTTVNSGYGVTSINIPDGWVLTCPFGNCTYRGVGRMLSGIKPGTKQITIISKDHAQADGGDTEAYAAVFRKKPA
jgi:hypothetical protein